jgi:multidrug efflux pump
MTSFAFILGVVPLLVGTGAGYEMRQTLGIAVFSGMLGVTLFGIFLTPVFFNVVEWFVETPLFRSEKTRHFGKVLLYLVGALTLGLFWIVPYLFGQIPRRGKKKDKERGRQGDKENEEASPINPMARQ